MNESERMTDLILEAYQKCKDNGHRMDWRRYSNNYADADCINCHCRAFVDKLGILAIQGSALTTECKGKEGGI